MNLCIRNTIIYLNILFYLLIYLSTEIFSLFNVLNEVSIKIFWSIILIISIFLIRKKKYGKFSIFLAIKKTTQNIQGYFILFILIITFLNSIIYTPNTLDAMTYHMTKVMHWIQYEKITFYPTNDLRELILAPLSEYVILHLYLIVGGDYLSNLVQWYSMFISCIVVSLITKELNCNLKYQIFSALFCATLPMGILQSSSTQTDYVTTMWLTIMVYFILKYIKENHIIYFLCFSISLGLGILTKGTFYFFAFPFCIWFGLILLFKSKTKFLLIFTIPLIVLIINSGHFYRNISLYGNPLGLSEENYKWNNEVLNIKSFSSNTIKNLSLNLSFPNKEINKLTSILVHKVHEHIGISPDDPRTSTGGRGFYIPFSFYESTSPNTLHFLMILLLIFYLNLKNEKNNTMKYYLLSVVSGFLLFSFLVKWMPQGNRILLSSFVLMSPFVSSTLSKSKLNKFTFIFSITIFLYAVPYLLFNKSRPLLFKLSFDENNINFYKPDFITLDRNELYYIADKFFNSRDLYNIHLNIVDKIKKSDCRVIGLDDYPSSNLDYPFWSILKKTMGNNEFYIHNVNIVNKSIIYSDNKQLDKICSIVDVDRVNFLN